MRIKQGALLLLLVMCLPATSCAGAPIGAGRSNARDARASIWPRRDVARGSRGATLAEQHHSLEKQRREERLREVLRLREHDGRGWYATH